MKKALIITYYWPPAGGSGVQRWLKFVKYLRDFNIEPVVFIPKNPHYPLKDATLKKDVPKNIEFISCPIWEPNALFSIFNKNKGESAGFLNANPSFFGKILQYIRANFFIPDARMFWIKPSVKVLLSYLKNNKIDCIITTGPPHSTHFIGLKLKQLLHIKWLADFRDPWTEIDYFHNLPLTTRAIKKHKNQEFQVLKNADAVVVVGESMKTQFEKVSNKVVTITNGYDTVINNLPVALATKFEMVHIGMMNADRNPEIFWKIISELIEENKQFASDFKLKLIGKIDTSVIKSIHQYKLNSYVETIDYVPHTEVINFQKKAQVLLVIVNKVPSAKGIVTGKIFEYLMAKRPILAIAPVDGDLAKIIDNTNSGTVVGFDDKEVLKNNILHLYKNYIDGRLEIHSKNIEQYHRKALTKKMAEIINTITE